LSLCSFSLFLFVALLVCVFTFFVVFGHFFISVSSFNPFLKKKFALIYVTIYSTDRL
jgi:hypothetical protein